MRDYAKLGKLNALVADADDDDDDKRQRGDGNAGYGAIHNFVADREIQKLGLALAQHSSCIKAVNSEAKPIQGVACVDWKGTYLQDSIRAAEKRDTLMSAFLGHNRPHRPLPHVSCGVGRIEKAVGWAVGGGIDLAVQGAVWFPCAVPKKIGWLDEDVTKIKYYTKIDLRSRYWQVYVVRGDEPKTTCVTRSCVNTSCIPKRRNFDRPFEVQLNAYDRALGGVLVQNKHPVAFESRKLKDVEMRYSTHEKEMTAVVYCLDAWRNYLLARWQEFLGEFDFEWVHWPRKQNDVANALSRNLVEEHVTALTVVDSDLLDQIRESSKMDSGHLDIDRMLALLAFVGIIGRGWRKMLRPT
ncbi:UNVERIFIED_CONTAM: RNA-directed DNA polymerase [Sesamum radiatum]|uniref:RNA-directed DNA polymerase n=1 Tax=Sesamum radiatum TaxID=300843 RepID=A0AAW2JDX6_SESRA